ncbi:restriction endonuclease subunit S [Streptococcus constellatus]|uniref:restriction endonuclease subunit S n=1 Tax=Streptococcus constellatus TaxID=76860 RepID=UPI0022E6B1BA|nr:restriction endonuclease subunit S [Streptococcus constellatus]
MNNWKKVKLSDIIEFNPRETLSKGAIAKKIAMEKLEPFTRDIPEFEYLEFRGGTKFRNGDTLMARITPSLENGKTSKVNLLDEDEVGFGSTEFIVVRAKENISDENFVYYLMIAPNIREVAIKSMVGTSGRQRVQLDVVKNHKILCPPLKEQIRIGKILKALDDKIENNRKINHHLEQIALSIFNKHFGKAETTNKLGDFFPVITGKKDANVAKGGKYPFFSCSQNISYTDNYSFDNKAILLAGNGDFNVKIYDGKFEAYQRTYVLIPNNDEQFGYLYYAIKYFLNDITSGYRGSVIKFITKGSIESFNIFMTDDKKVLSLFNIFVEKIANNNKETQELANLRDTLLPKLLSGEISVNQATK